MRRGELLPVDVVVQELNWFLRGWANFFRYGHSTARLGKVRNFALDRLGIFVGKRHKRGRSFGWNAVAYLSPDQRGLVSLSGIVVAPRANKPWREKPNADGERRR